MFKKINKGFTLVELLITMGIVVILGGIGTANYFNYQAVQVIDAVAAELAGTLRDAHQRAISQDNSSAWGVNIVNTADETNDYYELFYGDSRAAGTVLSRTTLPTGVEFLTPPSGTTREILFAKSTGLTGSDYTFSLISTRDSSLSRTTEVSKNSGLISSFTGLSDAPAVSSVAPDTALNTAVINITDLSGSNFQTDATVKLTKNGQTAITCTDVVVVDSTRLTLTCDITGAAVGAWDVVVTNPDDQAGTLSSGFIVSNQGGNVSGYAWSDNDGWVSFGCSNDSSCNTVEYGVDINSTTGLFTGYAWSDNSGWISFTASDLAGCPSGACEARVTGGFTGNFPKSVTGWARALSLVNEVNGGFISLSGTNPDYSVQLADDGKFSGYAWAPDLIGWLSFSGTDPYYQVSVLSDEFVVGGDTVPGAPTIGTATAGNAQASVAFSAPASDGGSAILDYTATSNPGGLTGTGASSPVTVTGLSNGTAYTFTVTARNAIGTGPASSASNSVTPTTGQTVPGAPTIGTATAGNAQASVTFTAPASDGGSAITGYTVTSNPGGLTGTGASSPITVTGLSNGTAYTFTVTATNAIGTGPASAASNSVTPVVPMRIFVTSITYTGALGGLTGADSLCQTRANAASLGGTWKAWLSDTSTSAATRLSHSSVPYYNMNNQKVADNWADLIDSSLSAAISYDETGASQTGYVFTNTNENGTVWDNTALYTCNNWTDGGPSYGDTEGNCTSTNGAWTKYTNGGMCYIPTRLYCVEQ